MAITSAAKEYNKSHDLTWNQDPRKHLVAMVLLLTGSSVALLV